MGSIVAKNAFLPPQVTYDINFAQFYDLKTKKVITADQIEDYESIIPFRFKRDYSIKTNHTLLYSHGNAEDIGEMRQLLDVMSSTFKVNMLIFDYIGYGLNKGVPSEKGCTVAIRAMYDYLLSQGVPSEKIILYGRSIGSGPTVDLAYCLANENLKIGGVILQSPIKSAVRVVSNSLHYVPCLDIFDNYYKIVYVNVPIIIFHGTNDKVVPYSHGKDLSKKLTSYEKKIEFITIEGAGHNNIECSYFNILEHHIKTFISSL